MRSQDFKVDLSAIFGFVLEQWETKANLPTCISFTAVEFDDPHPIVPCVTMSDNKHSD